MDNNPQPVCMRKAQHILNEITQKFYDEPYPFFTVEFLDLPSCGIMGDERVYGYAWNICGIPNLEDRRARRLLKEVGHRLTNEVISDDGIRFTRVMAEVLSLSLSLLPSVE